MDARRTYQFLQVQRMARTQFGGACAHASPRSIRLVLVMEIASFTKCWLDSGVGKELSLSSAQLIHLHWIGRAGLSIEEVGRFLSPWSDVA